MAHRPSAGRIIRSGWSRAWPTAYAAAGRDAPGHGVGVGAGSEGQTLMSIEGIIIGGLSVLLGAAFCFAGFRLFLLLLPIWGLFVGFLTGAGAMSVLLGETLLASALGIVVGIVVAVIFALLSWFYWWGALLVVAGALGYAVTHLVLEAIGFSADSWITIGIAIAAGLALAVVAFLANVPKYVTIILTAFAGSAWLTAGIAIFLGIVSEDDMANGSLVAVYREGWIWIVVWAVAAAAGIIAQLQATRRWEQDLVATYDRRKPF